MKDILQNIYAGLKKKISKPSNSEHEVLFPRIGILSDARKEDLEQRLGIKIHNPAYFEQALTHRSFLQLASMTNIHSNERLEFLGDAILGMIVAEYLFYHHLAVQEGELTKLRSWIVQRGSLAHVAKNIGLHLFIQLSSSAGKSLRDGNQTMLADSLEAIIAAIFLDSDFITAKEIVLTVWKNKIEEMKEIPIDAKSKLQEELQSRGLGLPKYELIEKSGPDHMLTFRVKVEVPGFQVSIGVGSSKQAAEKQAALNFLSYIL